MVAGRIPRPTTRPYTRTQIRQLFGITEDDLLKGIHEGWFPKPDYSAFYSGSRWHRSTIAQYLTEHGSERFPRVTQR